MYQLMINRKNSKKGFTLVEVIVVLVILAILAAIMIPAMTGWIDKAKGKSVLVEARTLYLAAQTLASEAYAQTPFTDPDIENVKALAGISGGELAVTYDAGKVKTFSYVKNGVTVTLTKGSLVADK